MMDETELGVEIIDYDPVLNDMLIRLSMLDRAVLFVEKMEEAILFNENEAFLLMNNIHNEINDIRKQINSVFVEYSNQVGVDE